MKYQNTAKGSNSISNCPVEVYFPGIVKKNEQIVSLNLTDVNQCPHWNQYSIT